MLYIEPARYNIASAFVCGVLCRTQVRHDGQGVASAKPEPEMPSHLPAVHASHVSPDRAMQPSGSGTGPAGAPGKSGFGWHRPCTTFSQRQPASDSCRTGGQNLAHSSPDVKGSLLPQPGEPFTSPIRSRPCPGRLFYAPSFPGIAGDYPVTAADRARSNQSSGRPDPPSASEST